MLFVHEEKVFSLSKTNGIIPDDISSQFGEFFAYLLLAGLYYEASPAQDTILPGYRISDDPFTIPANGYRRELGIIIARNLQTRMIRLLAHPDINDHERALLLKMDGVFAPQARTYMDLKASDIIGLAIRRKFDNNMRDIAIYTAFAFAQTNFPKGITVPRLYLSVFGNIHLALIYSDESWNNWALHEPTVKYGSRLEDGSRSTALWSILSSVDYKALDCVYPGDMLVGILSSLTFLTSIITNQTAVCVPVVMSKVDLQQMLLSGPNQRRNVIAYRAIRDALYCPLDTTEERMPIIRYGVLNNLLNVMMEMFPENGNYHLFSDACQFRREGSSVYMGTSHNEVDESYSYALEALDSPQNDDEKDTAAEPTPQDKPEEGDSSRGGDLAQDKTEEDPIEDPQTDDGGYSPSSPTPSVPAGTPRLDKNNIDLISFDKTSEGIDEDYYRAVVVALNDRIQRDDNVGIPSPVKEALDDFVNTLLYRVEIAETKNLISSLGLQKYLKNV